MQRTWPTRRPRQLVAGLLALLVVMTGLVMVTPQSASANEMGDSLYTRESPNEALAYPRVVRLEHSGEANGTLLATFERSLRDGAPSAFLIRQSTDDGATWETIANVGDPLTDANHPAESMWQPFIYEFPTTLGDYPAGTLIMAGNMAPERSHTDFVLWRSDDHGHTWEFETLLQTGGPSDGAEYGGTGIWEPFITLDGEGRLAMYFSDERQEQERAQILVHMVSEDGGDTWSANPDGSTNFEPGLVVDVASDVRTDRPGMPTVATLGDGSMVLAYEMCGNGRNCEAFIKTSTDGGETWGEGPSDLGTMVVSSDGRYLGSSPYVAWTPEGGPDGTLLLTGMRTRLVEDNSFTGEDQQAIFTNQSAGEGEWAWMPAPFQSVRDNSIDGCKSNYSPDLLVSADGQSVRFTSATTLANEGCMEATAEGSIGQLPYSSSFDVGQSGWIGYDGCWDTHDGVFSETCGDGGSKAVAGSTAWTDYTLEGDVRIDANGQAGFLVRVTDPSDGPDAHNAYYAGVSTNFLTLGRQDGSWNPIDRAPVQEGFAVGDWYHISVRAIGCTITVTGAPADDLSDEITLDYTDPDCTFTQGSIGLRAQPGPASWRDVTVTDASTNLQVALDAPEISYGSPVTATASNLPAEATGQIEFTAADEALCAVELPNLECTSTEALPVGTYEVTARYSGDEAHGSSSATTPLTVTKADVTLEPGAEPNPITSTGSTEFYVRGLADEATGTVTFTTGDGDGLCSAVLPDTTCRTAGALPVGEYDVNVAYSGDASYAPATASFVFAVKEAADGGDSADDGGDGADDSNDGAGDAPPPGSDQGADGTGDSSADPQRDSESTPDGTGAEMEASGGLASTGANLGVGVGVAALALVLAGLAALVWRRRRLTADSPSTSTSGSGL